MRRRDRRGSCTVGLLLSGIAPPAGICLLTLSILLLLLLLGLLLPLLLLLVCAVRCVHLLLECRFEGVLVAWEGLPQVFYAVHGQVAVVSSSDMFKQPSKQCRAYRCAQSRPVADTLQNKLPSKDQISK